MKGEKKQIKMRPHALGLLILLVLVNEPNIANGLCNIQKYDTLARCQHFEDIKLIDTHKLKSLKISAPGKRLSPEIFENLTSLRHLDLSNGKLHKIEPETFINLSALRSLDLSNNYLSQLGNGTLTGPKYLRHLNLRGNILDRIPPDIDDMKNLSFFDISQNKLFCDCKTLEIRDSLFKRGIDMTRGTICAGPRILRGVHINEPNASIICMFEKEEAEDTILMDQPAEDQLEGSGESGDPFDQLEETDIPEDEDKKHELNSSITMNPYETTSTNVEIPLTPHMKDDGMYFSEGVVELTSTLSASTSSEFITEASAIKDNPSEVKIINEGSGDDDMDEGSGIEGSGTGIVPPISWDQVEKEEIKNNGEESTVEDSDSQLTKTTTASSVWWSLFDMFGSSDSSTDINSSTSTTTTTLAPSSSDDVNLAQDGFIPLSSTSEAPIIDENPKVPVSEIDAFMVEKKPIENSKIRVLDESQSGKVQAEVTIDSTGLPDASSAVQNQKGMGSYLVLAVLLAVLATLICYAAYRGDFCNNGRKNSNRHTSVGNVENGTELKDLTKSLLDDENSAQPKISSNGNKSETVPLVSSPSEIETKSVNEPIAKYVGAVSDSNIDPVKPPRKSFAPNFDTEDERKNETNGKISSSPEITSIHNENYNGRSPSAKNIIVNGKHDRDSLSSVGETPSSLGSHSANLSNPRLSQDSPLSPEAHRVKITLQENPDSVPKTPLLITRTKAGENLVKAP